LLPEFAQAADISMDSSTKHTEGERTIACGRAIGELWRGNAGTAFPVVELALYANAITQQSRL
jgi:hypothetical protein